MSTHQINKTLGGIPKIIHQIWVGSKEIPKLNSLYMDTCKNMPGWHYRIWGNDDITIKNFPITYKYIQKVIDIGEEYNVMSKKYAQIADLMRLEILYQNGGVYIDSTAECLQNLDCLLDDKNYKFVLSNEDPCGLKCTNFDGDYYISNSFIASTKKNNVLRKILSKNNLNKIDLFSTRVNFETGPYFLGRTIHRMQDKEELVTMLPMYLIYPHGYESVYRSKTTDDLCYRYSKGPNTNLELSNHRGDHIYLEYPCKSFPNSYIIKHWEVGGTWK